VEGLTINDDDDDPLAPPLFGLLNWYGGWQVLTLGMTAYDTDIGLVGPDRYHLKFSGRRKTIRFPVLKMSFIKNLKNAANVTVNDVLYSAFAGE